MAENGLAIVHETQNPVEADMLYEMLKSNGIECFLLDRNASGQLTWFGPGMFIKIAVIPEHREKAMEILAGFKES